MCRPFDFPIAVPNDSNLVSLRFYLQLAGVDAAGVTVSNGLEIAACR